MSRSYVPRQIAVASAALWLLGCGRFLAPPSLGAGADAGSDEARPEQTAPRTSDGGASDASGLEPAPAADASEAGVLDCSEPHWVCDDGRSAPEVAGWSAASSAPDAGSARSEVRDAGTGARVVATDGAGELLLQQADVGAGGSGIRCSVYGVVLAHGSEARRLVHAQVTTLGGGYYEVGIEVRAGQATIALRSSATAGATPTTRSSPPIALESGAFRVDLELDVRARVLGAAVGSSRVDLFGSDLPPSREADALLVGIGVAGASGAPAAPDGPWSVAFDHVVCDVVGVGP